ncbi:hypothetical protein EDC65_2783 [Stella humosa]|uniref:VOC domain-containing protein n=1 Tax=Stella humosa TaxID=94 RepID=A0A3N1L8B6_9PROT|nr:hypothetical protein [Stella humosa]ROP90923.1 hypothetical protein EDC65_2783 [Stella humosa]BBK34727.1 hypothetical protein STHU_53610 [Stella humosa]
MMFHASIPARDPAATAAALAEMWQGEALPFPPLPGSFVVFAGDDRGTQIEVCPAEMGLIPGPTEVAATPVGPARPTPVHVAIGVPHDAPRILEIARRMGWTARECDRGGMFSVVEVWIDNHFMLEALTPAMQRDYMASMSVANWKRTFGLDVAA